MHRGYCSCPACVCVCLSFCLLNFASGLCFCSENTVTFSLCLQNFCAEWKGMEGVCFHPLHSISAYSPGFICVNTLCVFVWTCALVYTVHVFAVYVVQVCVALYMSGCNIIFV